MLTQIKSHLGTHPWAEQILYFDTIHSTNTYAKELATQGAKEGTIILAGEQTGGRGRLGRTFSSPAGQGIYLSVILRPNCLPKELMHLTCAAGVAATRALANPKIGIKWTNDLVMGKRKLGGILTEIFVNPMTQNVDWVVVGIGINCCQKNWQFPKEIRHMACSLNMDWQDVPWLIADLIKALFTMRQELLTEKVKLMTEFSARCVTIGQDISILRGDCVTHAKAMHIDADGGLVVEYPDGRIETVTSGEVSIRGMYGYL